MNRLEKEYSGRIEIVMLNMNDSRTAEAKAKYSFRAQPYCVLLDGDGRVVDKWQGNMEKAFFDDRFLRSWGVEVAKFCSDVKLDRVGPI